MEASQVNRATPLQVRYEVPAPRVARIVMSRPEARNAQGLQMTYELNDALTRAAHDTEISVIILAGDGPHFSAGHDLGGDRGKTWKDFPIVGTWTGFEGSLVEARYSREKEIYLEMTERWRNIPKPTIAEIQGNCIAGGLMLAWCCDLIVASADARFRDPTIDFGICGVEFFMHPWELGTRKGKEFLFTADEIDAEEACRRGMVNRVVEREKLQAETLALAKRIAEKPPFALKLAKEAMNHVQDTMGRRNAMMHVFSLHHLCHAENELQHGGPVNPQGIPPGVREKYLERIAKAKQQRQK